MANVFLPFAAFADGAIVVSVRYNDANGNVNQVRIVNNSPYPCVAYGTNPLGQTGSVTAPANQTTTQTVAWLQFDMIGWQPNIPENYILGARWPS